MALKPASMNCEATMNAAYEFARRTIWSARVSGSELCALEDAWHAVLDAFWAHCDAVERPQ